MSSGGAFGISYKIVYLKLHRLELLIKRNEANTVPSVLFLYALKS